MNHKMKLTKDVLHAIMRKIITFGLDSNPLYLHNWPKFFPIGQSNSWFNISPLDGNRLRSGFFYPKWALHKEYLQYRQNEVLELVTPSDQYMP